MIKLWLEYDRWALVLLSHEIYSELKIACEWEKERKRETHRKKTKEYCNLNRFFVWNDTMEMNFALENCKIASDAILQNIPTKYNKMNLRFGCCRLNSQCSLSSKSVELQPKKKRKKTHRERQNKNSKTQISHE